MTEKKCSGSRVESSLVPVAASRRSVGRPAGSPRSERTNERRRNREPLEGEHAVVGLLLLVDRAEVEAAVHEGDGGEGVDRQVDDLPEADARPPANLPNLYRARGKSVSRCDSTSGGGTHLDEILGEVAEELDVEDRVLDAEATLGRLDRDRVAHDEQYPKGDADDELVAARSRTRHQGAVPRPPHTRSSSAGRPTRPDAVFRAG